MSRIVAVIPARMGSSRFPGKPIAKILGKPMIQHVYERTASCPGLADVVIATCDDEIASSAKSFGANFLMTSPKHQRATDRVAEANDQLKADIVVMVQGDEPMLIPEMISSALKPIITDSSVQCVNLAAPIKSREEFLSPNTIKTVFDSRGDALYFSRSPIPYLQSLSLEKAPIFKQVCIIPFSREALKLFSQLRETPLEAIESIDMLRFLENGYKVRLVETNHNTQAVDTLEDLRLVESLMSKASI